MLIEARIENFRSVRDEQALSMEAASLGEPGDQRLRQVGEKPRPFLPAAAIYGANASGKSNWLYALDFMRQAVVDSHRHWSPSGGVVGRQPFAWGPKKQEPTLCEMSFLLDGVRHQYGFVADGERFLEEWVYAWPRGRKQTWLEREGQEVAVGDKLQGENRLVEEVLRPNALFLSTAAQLSHPQLTPIYRWFEQIRVFRKLQSLASGYVGDRSRYERLLQRREQIVDLLRYADFDVVDIKFVEIDPSVPLRPGHRIFVRHRPSEHAWLPLDDESSGTQRLFDMALDILEALATGSLLIIDELEASLHPLLACQVIRLFNEPASNPHNAQLLFATHDTRLLGTHFGEPLLRRDQVWLTEKDDDGASVLYPLTDYKPRKSENLERGYLQGRYGAIPLVGHLVRADA